MGLQTDTYDYHTGDGQFERIKRFWDYRFQLDGIQYVSTNEHGGYFFNFRGTEGGPAFHYRARCKVDEEKWLKFGIVVCRNCGGCNTC